MQEYSDVILRCGERRFDLHRFIVAPQSTWFAEKCAGRSRVSGHKLNLGVFIEADHKIGLGLPSRDRNGRDTTRSGACDYLFLHP